MLAHKHVGSDADARTTDAMHQATACTSVALDEQRQALLARSLGDGAFWVVYCHEQCPVLGKLEAQFDAS